MSQKQELKINKDVKVFIDGKTNARTIALPFRLPDGASAVVMLCRLKGEVWEPQKEITSITINYVKK
jgi:hypothetical protein